MSFNYSIKFDIEPNNILNQDSHIMLFGSCFTEHIGQKLKLNGFETCINPFGILFNSESIANAIHRIANKKYYNPSELYKNHEDRFVSFDHHGRFSGMNLDEVLDGINKSILSANQGLIKTDTIIITLGSAWVYRFLEQDKIVANCHRIAAKKFIKEMQSIDNIVNNLNQIINDIKSINLNSNILFTISPVKHLRDGIVENQRSKATLILALDNILKQNLSQIYYYPAYEIVNDELRDYRFYDKDFAHPNDIAIDYVWQRFVETYLTTKAIEKIRAAENSNKSLSHKTLKIL